MLLLLEMSLELKKSVLLLHGGGMIVRTHRGLWMRFGGNMQKPEALLVAVTYLEALDNDMKGIPYYLHASDDERFVQLEFAPENEEDYLYLAKKLNLKPESPVELNRFFGSLELTVLSPFVIQHTPEVIQAIQSFSNGPSLDLSEELDLGLRVKEDFSMPDQVRFDLVPREVAFD